MVAMRIAITLSRIADRSHEGKDSVQAVISMFRIQAAVPVNQTLGPFTLAKTKIQKTWVFVVPFTLPDKPITYRVFFGKKSACTKKLEYHTGFLVSGAHARLLSTFDRMFI